MQRKSTDYHGWANEIEYLAEEAERQSQKDGGIALVRREEKTSYKRARLWQAALICFLTAVLALASFWGWLSGALRSIGLP